MIIKVDKYPEKKQPQLSEILDKKLEYFLKMKQMMKILNKIIKSMFDEKEKKFAFI